MRQLASRVLNRGGAAAHAVRGWARSVAGQSSVEYVGMIVVAAITVGVLIAAGPAIGRQLQSGVQRAVCMVSGESCGGSGGPGAVAGAPGGLPGGGSLPPGLGPPSPVAPGQTFGPGTGGMAASPTGTQADPVDSLTGAFETSVTDARMPGIGMPFAFARSYSSALAQRGEAGPLGPGWSATYTAALKIEPGARAVTLQAGDGQRLEFTRQVDRYLGAPGARSSLRRRGSGWEVVTRRQVRWRFDGAGRLEQISDRNGNRIALARTPAGALAGITDTAGRTIRLRTGGGGRITRLTLPDGRDVSYRYEDGRLSEVTDLRGGVTRYEYDDKARITKITDQLDHTVVENEYGDAGRVTRQTDGLGHESRFAWDARAQTSTMTDARGNRWQDVYRNGALVARVDPEGGATLFGYDPGLDVRQVTDARGHTTSFRFDGRGNLTSITAPAPFRHRQTLAYNARNDVIRHTDAKGRTTRFSYDARGNLVAMRGPLGTRARIERDPATGLVTAAVDPLDRTIRMRHDRAGNLIRLSSPMGRGAVMAYDRAGRRVRVTDTQSHGGAQGHRTSSTSFAYDAADALVRQTSALGTSVRLAYDRAGNVVQATDVKGRAARYEYDEANRVTKAVAPGDVETSFERDAAGNVTKVTDPRGHPTSYGYDAANRLVEATDAAGRRSLARYDVAGNMIAQVTARGTSTGREGDGTIRYGYDALGRLTAVDYSDATPDVGLRYDAAGNLVGMRDGSGGETRAYDALDRLVVLRRGGEAFRYGYDAGGQLVSRRYPDGSRTTYGYNDDGQLASATSPLGVTSYGYDDAGDLVSTLLPNGVREQRRHDFAGRLVELRNVRGRRTLSFAGFTFDALGNPTSKRTERGIERYGYDERDRLTSVCYRERCAADDPALLRFGYDAVSNRTSAGRAGQTTRYEYDDTDRLAEIKTPQGTTSYAHDADGNVLRAGARRFSYDLASRLTSVRAADGSTARYAYDGMGKRSSTVVDSGRQRTSWDVLFAVPQVALQRDQGRVVRRYYYGKRRLAASGPGGRDTSFHLRDELGSVVGLTSPRGRLLRREGYTPYGEARGRAPGGDRFAYTGERLDGDTGLYHLRARDYDPASGRFLQQDPIGPAIGNPARSPYAYVDGRPTVLTDPTGMFTHDAIGNFVSDRAEDVAGTADDFWDSTANEREWVEGAAEDTVEWTEGAVEDTGQWISENPWAPAAAAAVGLTACTLATAGACGVAALTGGSGALAATGTAATYTAGTATVLGVGYESGITGPGPADPLQAGGALALNFGGGALLSRGAGSLLRSGTRTGGGSPVAPSPPGLRGQIPAPGAPGYRGWQIHVGQTAAFSAFSWDLLSGEVAKADVGRSAGK